MRGYDDWKTAEPPIPECAPELPYSETRHKFRPDGKECGGEIRYTRMNGDYVFSCEVCGPYISEDDVFDSREDGCPICGHFLDDLFDFHEDDCPNSVNFSRGETYDEEYDCCVTCANEIRQQEKEVT